MPISDYFKHLRSKVGNTLLQIPGVAAIIHDETGKVLLQQRTDDNSVFRTMSDRLSFIQTQQLY